MRGEEGGRETRRVWAVWLECRRRRGDCERSARAEGLHMHYERRGLMQPLQRETTAGPACRLRWVRSVVIARARACAASMAEAKYSLSQCYYFEVTVEKELHADYLAVMATGHRGSKCRHCRHTAISAVRSDAAATTRDDGGAV